MPANKNAETRYQILDRLLANRYHHYSTEDLRQRVNEELDEIGQPPVSIRTIQLDLNYLENGPFAADIEHYQIDEVSQKDPNKTVNKNCHRYRDRSFSIFQQKLTEDEKHILGEAFSLLGQFDGLPNLDGLFFTIQCVDNYELIRELCAFGKDLLVLSPDNIKQKIYNRVAEQEKAYQALFGIETK